MSHVFPISRQVEALRYHHIITFPKRNKMFSNLPMSRMPQLLPLMALLQMLAINLALCQPLAAMATNNRAADPSQPSLASLIMPSGGAQHDAFADPFLQPTRWLSARPFQDFRRRAQSEPGELGLLLQYLDTKRGGGAAVIEEEGGPGGGGRPIRAAPGSPLGTMRFGKRGFTAPLGTMRFGKRRFDSPLGTMRFG